MGLFKKLFGSVNEEQGAQNVPSVSSINTGLNSNSPYDVGYAFASLVTCATQINPEDYYMASARYISKENKLTLSFSSELFGTDYAKYRVPAEVFSLLKTLSSRSVEFSGSMDLERMKASFEKGINTSVRRPYVCNLKSYTMGDGAGACVDLDVTND